MQKTYVLDTNVLIQAPYAMLSFEENNLFIPVVVLEELGKLKTEEGEVGANARIIIRTGKGTKVILLGDPKQIDHPLLDERTNGLSYAAEKMKGSSFCFQVGMKEECERSRLAKNAALRM